MTPKNEANLAGGFQFMSVDRCMLIDTIIRARVKTEDDFHGGDYSTPIAAQLQPHLQQSG